MHNDSTVGLDEAGRGPMLGPMVICGVFGDSSSLSKLGVRDSKQLTPAKRTELSLRIREEYEWKSYVISPGEIDAAVLKGGLNDLEAVYFARIISEMGHERAVVDCADVNERRFAEKIGSLSSCPGVDARHRADVMFPQVSAASIVAKVERDSIIAKLQEEAGEAIGSGYPSDPVTVDFLRKHYARSGDLPPFVRRSWEPVRRLLSISKIKNLDDFR